MRHRGRERLMSNGEKNDPPRPPLQDYLQNTFVGDASKALAIHLSRVIEGMSTDVADLLADKGASTTETSMQMAQLTSEMIRLFGQRVGDILQDHLPRATKGDDGTAAPPDKSAPGF